MWTHELGTGASDLYSRGMNLRSNECRSNSNLHEEWWGVITEDLWSSKLITKALFAWKVQHNSNHLITKPKEISFPMISEEALYNIEYSQYMRLLEQLQYMNLSSRLGTVVSRKLSWERTCQASVCSYVRSYLLQVVINWARGIIPVDVGNNVIFVINDSIQPVHCLGVREFLCNKLAQLGTIFSRSLLWSYLFYFRRTRHFWNC